MKIRAVGEELFHANGRTDGQDEANSRFDNFANAPTNKQAYGITVLCVCGFVSIYTSNQTVMQQGMNIRIIENSPMTYKVQRN